MADDQIQVQMVAQMQDLLSGLEQAAQGISSATGKMTDQVEQFASKSRKSTEETSSVFEGMGKQIMAMAAGFGVGALLEKALEGVIDLVKSIPEYIMEAVNSTNELAESYKTIGYATGASTPEINTWVAAAELSGQTAQDVEQYMVGMQRGIKANSDALIANGVASNKAALMSMSYEDYLKRVSAIADSLPAGTERMQFMIMALGKSGAKAGADLKEFVDGLEEANRLTESGSLLTEINRQQLEETEKSVGHLKVAQQTYAALVAINATSVINNFRDMHTAFVTMAVSEEAMMDLATKGLIEMQYQQDNITLDFVKMAAAAEAYYKIIIEGNRTAKDSMDAGVHFGPEKTTHLKDPKADAAAAAEKEKKRKEAQAAADKDAAATLAYNNAILDGQIKQLEMGSKMNEGDKENNDILIAKLNLQKEINTINAEKGQSPARKAALIDQAKANELTQEEIALRDSLQRDLDSDKKSREEAAKDAKDAAQQAHIAALKQMEDIEAVRSSESAYLDLDKQSVIDYGLMVGMSNINKLEDEKDFLAKQYKLYHDAIIKKMDLDGLEPKELERLNDQKLQMERKYLVDKAKLDSQLNLQSSGALGGIKAAMIPYAEAMVNVFDRWKAAAATAASSIANTFSSSFKSILMTGKITSEGIKGFFISLYDTFATMVANMLTQWIMGQLAQMMFSKTTKSSDAAGAAALYAVNAASSVAAIPFYGWAMAPGVMAEAYASGLAMAGLASAKGGWDSVDGDQVIRAHDREMVLSQPIADKVRNMADGGGKATVNINTFDAAGVRQFLGQNSTQNALLRSLKDMHKKGFK